MVFSSSPSQPPTQGFKVRPARRGDAGPIVALLAEVQLSADSNTVTWIISHPEMEILVAADHLDRVIGFVTLSHRPILHTGGRAAHIDELNVAKAWRRKGVAKELLRRIVERAKVLSVKRLQVQTYGGVTDDIVAFFAACAFERTHSSTFQLK
jgi:N-acetylglutamate synthase-like GNAT family acetyltransferase